MCIRQVDRDGVVDKRGTPVGKALRLRVVLVGRGVVSAEQWETHATAGHRCASFGMHKSVDGVRK